MKGRKHREQAEQISPLQVDVRFFFFLLFLLFSFRGYCRIPVHLLLFFFKAAWLSQHPNVLLILDQTFIENKTKHIYTM